ncbi:MAG: hypothetical protein DRI86_00970 [Bacteroidetes bacterium]|nr:MAG: hypothetical protein DRI86_00970 [Bacteroidota bacterium]
MRNIFNIFGTIVEDNNKFFAFRVLLPEIYRVELNFHKPTGRLSDGNVVDYMEVIFINDTSLKINGMYLHKFFDTPPDTIATEDGEYIANNPHSDIHSTVEMITFIRQAFTIILDIGPSAHSTPFKNILLDFGKETGTEKGNITKSLYPTLKEEVSKNISIQLLQKLESASSKFKMLLIDFIKDAAMKPRVKREWVRTELNEESALQNSFTEIEWGNDLSLLTFSKFLQELDPEKGEVPFYTSYNDRLKEFASKHIEDELNEVFKDIKKQGNNDADFLLSYIKEQEYDVDKSTNLFIEDNEYITSLVLLNYWYDCYSKKTIAEIIS